MTTTRKKVVTDNWKALGGFLALLLTNAAFDLSKSGQVIPATGADWIRWGASQVAGTLIVYGFPANTNRPRPRRRTRKPAA